MLIFDEPTASLSEEDTRNLFRVIRELRGPGVGIVELDQREQRVGRLLFQSV